jgi:hypothetical protein
MTGKASDVFKRIAGAFSGREKDTDAPWEWDNGRYPRLLSFDPARLGGRSGIYVLWHLGVRPQWLRVGYASDLGATTAALAVTPSIMAYSVHDGPFFSWRFCRPEDAAGMVKFLAGRLNPVLQSEGLTCDAQFDPTAVPVPCDLPSGTKDIQVH